MVNNKRKDIQKKVKSKKECVRGTCQFNTENAKKPTKYKEVKCKKQKKRDFQLIIVEVKRKKWN